MTVSSPAFVAINYINCQSGYKERFEALFKTRVKAIDRVPGFVDMQVLSPNRDDDDYLIISRWENEESFKAWTNSAAFLEGHKRGFEDIARFKEEGKPSPMTSSFRTYWALTD